MRTGGLFFCYPREAKNPLDLSLAAAYLRPPKRVALRIDARSSNGKRADSDSVNQGSNPCRASKYTNLNS